MTHSQSADALVSVRWVVADHYQGEPVPGLDPLVSDFTGFNIKRVPVIRVFGSTCAGQRACLHIHGVFPYLFVPLPSGEKDGFEYRLSASLDKALNISLGQSSASTQHVYKAVKVNYVSFSYFLISSLGEWYPHVRVSSSTTQLRQDLLLQSSHGEASSGDAAGRRHPQQDPPATRESHQHGAAVHDGLQPAGHEHGSPETRHVQTR